MNEQVLEHHLLEKNQLFTKNQAVAEAERCLYCFEPPCVKACPTEIDIPNFIKKIASGDTKSAAVTILSSNILGESCARACPVEVLCAGSCVYNLRDEPAIEIGRLQRFATNLAIKESALNLLGPKKSPTGKKIALVGAGPASLAAASLLALEGHEAIIFERNSYAGGLNANGIAGYKFDHASSQREVDWLLDLGATLKLNTEVVVSDPKPGQITTEDLKKFDAIFLGLGLGSDKKLFSHAKNVIGACELIDKIKTNPEFSLEGINRCHIIGGGNTAIDAAHQLKLLGVDEVSLLYRSDRKKMSAYAHELDAALATGVALKTNASLDRVVEEHGKITGFYLLENENFYKTDLLVMAIGQAGEGQELAQSLGVKLDEKGRVIVDKKTYQTSNPKVFSAGDLVSGGQEVVNAVAEAKIAVKAINELLMK